MKAQIHPQWNSETAVTCACGTKFSFGSTLNEISVEICSHCHPFYTGQMKFVDTKGRVEAFRSKQAAAQSGLLSKNARRAMKRTQRIDEEEQRPESLSELRKEFKKKSPKN
jgi:large subunit ribosomal protein L31